MKVSALYLLATFPKRRSRYQSIEAGTTFHIRPNAFDFHPSSNPVDPDRKYNTSISSKKEEAASKNNFETASLF
ncbi:hypothetical protein HR15_04660 [Porphyromonas gulae]|uniref:Uncharacterized protein n=1 Tax=Porphyromonas gulae TaxID=111105 RepID=A0A0A2FEQ4_9PORP|nr:hypothetical protein HR15_04660 [Porphyromonas gulae]